MRFGGTDQYGTPRPSDERAPYGWVIIKITGFQRNIPVDNGYSCREDAEEVRAEMPDAVNHKVVPATRREMDEINEKYEDNDDWDEEG